MTTIKTIDGKEFEVKETPKEIMDMIENGFMPPFEEFVLVHFLQSKLSIFIIKKYIVSFY